jgi:hypothetical protein
LFGGRDGDQSGWLASPGAFDTVHEFGPVLQQYRRTQGTNHSFGHQLASVVHGAGFENIVPTASYRMFNTPEKLATLVRIAEGLFTDPQMLAFAEQQGYDLADKVPSAIAEVRAWAASPAAFRAQSQCEVVAWKPCEPVG